MYPECIKLYLHFNNIMDAYLKFIYFFHREYSLRHIYKSEFFEELSVSVENLLDFCRNYFSKNQLPGSEKAYSESCKFDINFEVQIVDLLLDIYVGKINNEKFYSGITDYYYGKNFNDSGDDLALLKYLEDVYRLIMSSTSNKNSLDFIYELSSKYEIYVSHAKYLHIKKIKLDSIFSDIDLNTEKKFFQFKKFDDYYKYFSPSEVVCGLDVDPESYVNGSYAIFIDFKSSNFDIDKTLEYIQASVVDTLLMLSEVDNRELSSRELEYLSKNCKVIRKSSFDVSGLQNRLLGLIMWDLVNIFGYDTNKAFHHLISTNDYFKHEREKNLFLLNGVIFDIMEENDCKKLNKIAIKSLNNACECVDKCRIVSTNPRISKKNKNKEHFDDGYIKYGALDFRNDGKRHGEVDIKLLKSICGKGRDIICYEEDDGFGSVKFLADMFYKAK